MIRILKKLLDRLHGRLSLVFESDSPKPVKKTEETQVSEPISEHDIEPATVAVPEFQPPLSPAPALAHTSAPVPALAPAPEEAKTLIEFTVNSSKPELFKIPEPEKPQLDDFSDMKWLGLSGKEAKETGVMASIAFSNKRIRYIYEALNGWPLNHDKTCNAYLCLFFFRNGEWTGGKFEWNQIGQCDKSVFNVIDGYFPGIMPVPGEDAVFCLLSLDGKQRTSFKKFKFG